MGVGEQGNSQVSRDSSAAVPQSIGGLAGTGRVRFRYRPPQQQRGLLVKVHRAAVESKAWFASPG
ncbi:hypothetical protein GCM10009799_21950 [Nocardiopsis rhodophaea]|uniref:Transposase n=1 Tax=Nocardiopsis rhodophaea TaxID=280238 RepID=A0ABN2T064_9ACTN